MKQRMHVRCRKHTEVIAVFTVIHVQITNSNGNAKWTMIQTLETMMVGWSEFNGILDKSRSQHKTTN